MKRASAVIAILLLLAVGLSQQRELSVPWSYLPVAYGPTSSSLLGVACCVSQDTMVDTLGLSSGALNANDWSLFSDGRDTQFLRLAPVRNTDNAMWFDGTPRWSVAFDAFVTTNPGQWYIVGNEPDVPAFDYLSPTEYAQWFQNVRSYILARDPTARFASAGPAHWHNVDDYLAELALLEDGPDVVGLHIYALGVCIAPEWVFIQKLESQVSMAQSYFPGRPVWLTEFGWLAVCAIDEGRAAEFMRAAVSEIETVPIVARAAWWPTWITGGGTSEVLRLLDGGALTLLGAEYRGLAR